VEQSTQLLHTVVLYQLNTQITIISPESVAIGIFTQAKADRHLSNAVKLLDAIDDKLVEDVTAR
jgi:hypothetical protein